MSRSCLSMQRASNTRKEMVIHGVQRTLWLGTQVRSGCLPACFSTPKKIVQREAEQQKSMEMKISQDWWCQEVLRAGFHGKGWLCNATQWLQTATLGCFSGEESVRPCKGGVSDVSCHVRQPCRYAQTGRGYAAEDALFSDLSQSEGLKFVG